MVGDEIKIRFWEDLWWGDQPLCSQFPRLFKVVTTRNLSFSVILGSDAPWNFFFFFFCCNLIDLEIKDFERLMTSLSRVHLCPFVSDAKA